MKDEFVKIRKDLEFDIITNGSVVHDRRLDRHLYSLPGHHYVIGSDSVDAYTKRAHEIELDTFSDDWRTILRSGWNAMCKEAMRDPGSRRLMVFNCEHFLTKYQCFVSFHFVWTYRGEFDLYVYQRSCHLDKLHNDLTFYGHVINEFEKKVDESVTKIVIIFGSIHYDVTTT